MDSINELMGKAESGTLNRDDQVALLAALSAVQLKVARSIAASNENRETADRLLDIKEAAERLHVTEQWLRRRTDKLPFVVKLDGNVRYSVKGIERYIANHRG